jgi:hypothetical protein
MTDGRIELILSAIGFRSDSPSSDLPSLELSSLSYLSPQNRLASEETVSYCKPSVLDNVVVRVVTARFIIEAQPDPWAQMVMHMARTSVLLVGFVSYISAGINSAAPKAGFEAE